MRDAQAFGEDAEEWWVHRSGLLASKAGVDRELEKLSASRKNLEDTLDALRCCINKISRPFLRGLRILDLPDEILHLIFEFVEDRDDDSEYSHKRNGGEDIKRCRLACRRFYGVASRMLVRLVRVDHRVSSLSRLDEISRHPIISKGVCAVRVVLHYYDSMLSTHIEKFIPYRAAELEQQLDVFEDMLSSGDLADMSDVPDETSCETARKAREVLAAWRRLTPAPSSDGEEDYVYRALLEQAYEKYQHLYEEQESLRKSGKFAQIVGSYARKPEFRDSDSETLGGPALTTHRGDVCATIYQRIVEPMGGFHAIRQGLEPPPYQVISEVPGAVRSAGVWLEDIDIELLLPGDFQLLVSGPETREKLSPAVQQLRNFSFKCKAYTNEQDSSHPNEFLEPCLDTPSLERLNLDLNVEDAADDSEIGRVDEAITLRP